MINPAEVDLSALPSVPLEDRSRLPSEPCIYFAIDAAGVVQYIGRSINPRQRWVQHHRYKDLDDLNDVRIAYLFADADLLPAIERALIAWFKPALNQTHIKIRQPASSKPDRGHHPNSAQTRFTGKGIGTKNKLSPISVRFSADAHAVLIGMEDRQDYIRAAVLAKLEADGLLKKTDRLAELDQEFQQTGKVSLDEVFQAIEGKTSSKASSDLPVKQKPDIRQEYYDDFMQRRQARQSTDL